jgi:UDP-galactopyranose mutase
MRNETSLGYPPAGTIAFKPRKHAMEAEHEFDWLVVGAGFAGSVLAERLATERGEKVLVIDRRPHVGGNAYDEHNSDGLLIHRYGPHIFHTNADAIVDYLSRFTEWRPYEHRVLASVNNMLVPIPINLDTINRLYGLQLNAEGLEQFFAERAEPVAEIKTSEDVVVSRVGRELYEMFFRNYTRKQWGLDPSELDKSVTSRVPVRTNHDDRYFTDTFQAMPAQGYTRMFERMLDHPNITVMLDTDYFDVRDRISFKRMVFTGPIDAFFGYRFGKLPYRSLRFEHVTLDKQWHQPVGVVNYPQDKDYTRVTEYKHLTGQEHSRTALTYEYPADEGDPYYPVPREETAALFRQYDALARSVEDVFFVGRLATYRYYNMDQVVGQALATFRRINETLGAPRKPAKRTLLGMGTANLPDVAMIEARRVAVQGGKSLRADRSKLQGASGASSTAGLRAKF